MKEGVYRGVRLRSAVVVIHAPNRDEAGGRRRMSGAIASSSGRLSAALDYAAREGRWADKSDIDREATPDDERLMRSAEDERRRDEGRRRDEQVAELKREEAARAREMGLRAAAEAAERELSEMERRRGAREAARDAVSDRLDYASREGRYAGKGRSRMTDAALWDAKGPVEREKLEREMREAGGAFMDSVVSVRREDAEVLGLSTKQDFQRLLRETWTRSASRWQWFRGDESDVRWVAAFHDDASASYHCHVYTWSASGRIPEHATVDKRATREAKDVVLDVAYRQIRQERNARAEICRDAAIECARRAAGGRGDDRRAERLERRGREVGLEVEIPRSSDLPEGPRQHAEGIRQRMAAALEHGEGRLSRNRPANEAARELFDLVRRTSPATRELADEYMRLALVKADSHGYDERGTKEVVRKDKAELYSRGANALRALEVRREPWREGRADRDELRRQASERQAAREREPGRGGMRQAISRSSGATLEQAARIERALDRVRREARSCGARSFDDAPASARAAAMAAAREICRTPKFEASIARSAARASDSGGRSPRFDADMQRGRIVERIARTAFSNGVEEARFQSRLAAERAGQRAAERAGRAMSRTAASLVDLAIELASSSSVPTGGAARRGVARGRGREREHGREHARAASRVRVRGR